MIEITNPGEMQQGKPARYRRLQDENLLLEELENKVGTYTGTQISP
jgi:hypothetical protein